MCTFVPFTGYGSDVAVELAEDLKKGNKNKRKCYKQIKHKLGKQNSQVTFEPAGRLSNNRVSIWNCKNKNRHTEEERSAVSSNLTRYPN